MRVEYHIENGKRITYGSFEERPMTFEKTAPHKWYVFYKSTSMGPFRTKKQAQAYALRTLGE